MDILLCNCEAILFHYANGSLPTGISDARMTEIGRVRPHHPENRFYFRLSTPRGRWPASAFGCQELPMLLEVILPSGWRGFDQQLKMTGTMWVCFLNLNDTFGTLLITPFTVMGGSCATTSSGLLMPSDTSMMR
jgi:hypothetical protein